MKTQTLKFIQGLEMLLKWFSYVLAYKSQMEIIIPLLCVLLLGMKPAKCLYYRRSGFKLYIL